MSQVNAELSGFGLFACTNFAVGEVVTIYVGKVIENNVDSIYSITNTEVTLDAGPWLEGFVEGVDFRDQTYLGGHMANDAGWVVEGGGGENDENIQENINISKRFEFVASKPIKAGDEILYDYNYNGV